MSKRQVERLETLLRLPPVIQDAIADQDMTTSHGLALLQCAARQDPDAFDYEAWTRVVSEEQLTVAQLQVRLALAGYGPRGQWLRLERGGKTNGLRLISRTGCLELHDLTPEKLAELRAVLQGVIAALDVTAASRDPVPWPTEFEI